VSEASKSAPEARRRAVRELLLYGLFAGALIAVLHLLEFRLLAAGRSFGIYAGLVALLFAGIGIWLGLKLRKETPAAETIAPGPFLRDETQMERLGITPRELEILELIAHGMSNREIAARLFISENTVKTHSSRVFDKLGARRRTQAVRLGKAMRLIP
jgi:DNA-binding CsgD family transcriptional regulator